MADDAPAQGSGPDEGPGVWEEQEFSERMYGRVRFTPNHVPLVRLVPNKEMIWFINIAVSRLLARAARSGWHPAEPTDALSLWNAGRIDYTVTGVGLFMSKYEVTFHRLRIHCHRRAPDPGSGS